MMKITGFWIVLFAVGMLGCLVESKAIGQPRQTQAMTADSFRPYPIRNGDFSTCVSHGLPANWASAVVTGKPKFSLEVPSGRTLTQINPHAVALIETRAGERGLFYHDVPLMPGSYIFNVEVSASDSAEVNLSIAGQSRTVVGPLEWQNVQVPFSATSNERLVLSARGPGNARFRKAWVDIASLTSTLVPMADGTALGAIVLPQDPGAAEEFAAYELQHYVYKMTGIVPGLEGRDAVFPGRRILIGLAAQAECSWSHQDLPADSYLVDADENRIVLWGKNPRGTLYAAYDFLKLQGCGWYVPGPVGEVVPHVSALAVPQQRRIEIPDYDVRGFLAGGARFYPGGGWINYHADDYYDWAVRNRMNALWTEYGRTSDLGAHRGYGHDQTVNHSWRIVQNLDHPEWWSLVDGKRTRLHQSGRWNMPCISNPELRNYAVKYVIDFFANNPAAKIFALNPEDEPAFWCECENCRALDADQGQGKWEKDSKGYPALSMTDRTVNFVNYVAQRVSEVYPDRLIELYIYGSYREPPQRNRVHPNVLSKYTFWPGSPLNRPLLDTTSAYNGKVIDMLDGWTEAGAKQFGLYNYGDFFHMDRPIFWFYSLTDSLKTFHQRWHFRHCLGEAANDIFTSFMWHNIRNQALWDTEIDYEKAIRRICQNFYGPAAATMIDYYDYMTATVMASEAWKQPDYSWVYLADQDLVRVVEATRMLEQALQQVGNDRLLEERIQIARFGHAMLTFMLAQRYPDMSAALKDRVEQAFALANKLSREYGIKVSQSGATQLSSIYFPPHVSKTLYKLPLEWQFKKDPEDKGLAERWFTGATDETWQAILTNRDWTAQGHAYHGVAWYAVTFQMGLEETKQREFQPQCDGVKLLVGAVDGYADIYLNGRKIGEQKEDVGKMWDKAFTVNVPGGFDAAVKNTLVIRVQKDSHAAGIWKPVSIVYQDPDDN